MMPFQRVTGGLFVVVGTMLILPIVTKFPFSDVLKLLWDGRWHILMAVSAGIGVACVGAGVAIWRDQR